MRGRVLKNDERTSITSGDGVSCLLLQNITADDSGKYDICVENSCGADCTYASVSVEGPPDPPSGSPCISPESPTSVRVTWSSSPYDGGRCVDGYVLEYCLVGSGVWAAACRQCHSLSHSVRGLTPGGRYAFRVRAVNALGASRPSAESQVVQMQEEDDESSLFEPRIVHIEPGLEFVTRYEVLEELGKGRFGVVHKVIEKRSGQKFAAKFVRCRTAKDRDKLIFQVQDEIDIMNMLRHQKLLQLAAAFENPREMVMVMEYISGGELFERVVADDFTLTEKDCILFMRQICEGVAYMHRQQVVHLDLKPENIMCHTRMSHEIKIIDFGLSQKIDPNKPIRVLFGTPEFIPPEIISYEPIGVQSDMWSIGVICYVLLSGLSPFMGDNDSETFANITRAYYDFEDEAFNTVSQDARDFISALLVKRKEERLSAEQCLKHVWLDPENHHQTVVLSTDKLKKFIIRRKWQKTGNAIRALGRMATLSASRRSSTNSCTNSTPTTPRPSLSGASIPRMSSLCEEEKHRAGIQLDLEEELDDDTFTPLKAVKEQPSSKAVRTRALDEDKLDLEDDRDHLETSDTYKPLKAIKDQPSSQAVHGTRAFEAEEKHTSTLLDLEDDRDDLETSDTYMPLKAIKEQPSAKAVRTRAFSERSDSGISDCSSHLTASSSCTSTPLLGKKFCINEDVEYVVDPGGGRGVKVDQRGGTTTNGNGNAAGFNLKLNTKLDGFSNGQPVKSKSPSAAGSLKRLPIYTSRTVANTIKKFDQPENQNSPTITKTDSFTKSDRNRGNHVSKIDKIVERLSTPDKPTNGSNTLAPTVRYRSPSPSLLRKTQAVIAKEQANEYFVAKQGLKSPLNSPKLNRSNYPKSPSLGRKDKPKSESFQKAAAFWSSPKT
ncbi:unnamed protein product [Callosobruchus maculatus]|uniref:Protein kinase domain-containing protein n=2 Tax=Callosobruchus maculatus TaxID=64391 RepID=A0A653D1X0_CALMS|nr:unnamed protein product [Callosobruchus maculatus]